MVPLLYIFQQTPQLRFNFAVSSKCDPVAGMKNERPRHITRCAHDPASGGRSDQYVMSSMFVRQTSADALEFIPGWHGWCLWCNYVVQIADELEAGIGCSSYGTKIRESDMKNGV